ncbi:MAG: tetratricopeptide repeat protein [Pyrinomonadaceae bacterium]
MKNKRRCLKAVFSAFVIWTILISSFPFLAQDVVTSEDFSGSSVFVFRKSRPIQNKAAFRSTVRLNLSQRSESHRQVRIQAGTVASSQRRKTPKVDPNTIAVNLPVKGTTDKNLPPVNTATKEKTSIVLAGAAETYLDQGDLARAIDYFQQAIELNPANEDAKLGLSKAYSRRGEAAADKENTKEAIKYYSLAMTFNKKNVSAYVGLAEAYENDEADDKAIENYEKALALDARLTDIYAPLGMLYFQKDDIPKADKYLSKADSNSASGDVQYYLGLIRYKQNQNEQAIAAFQKSLQANPNSAETHYYLGETYDRLDRDQEALAEYNKTVEINPNYVEAWFDLGVANFNRRRYDDAVTAYKQVLKLKNDDGKAHENLADVYRLMALTSKDADKRKQYYGLANGEYSIAAAFIKDDAELYSNWAFCLGRVEKWQSSIDKLMAAVKISPAASDYSNIGWASLNSALLDKINKQDAGVNAKLETGKSALQKAIALDPKLSAAYVNLGMISSELGEYQAAVNALTTALQLRGDYWVLDHELGYAYRQLNDFDNAVKYFKKTTELNDKYADGFYNLGEAEYRRGNLKEAKKAMERLRQLDAPLANRLDSIIKGAKVTDPKSKNQNKVN